MAPELEVSTFYPGYGEDEVPGLFSWGYLRAGLEETLGPVSLVASAALRSRPFSEGLELALPVSAGAELRWHSADSPIVLSLIAAGEIEGKDSYYFMGGLCLGWKQRR